MAPDQLTGGGGVGLHRPSGNNQRRPRNVSTSSNSGTQSGVDLAALAAMIGTGPAQLGTKAAPPLTAINLEDLGKDSNCDLWYL